MKFNKFKGGFWLFWAQMGYFEGQDQVKKKNLEPTHVVEQLLVPMFPSILTFDFDLILRSLWLFRVLMGYFLGCSIFQKPFLV